MKKTIIVCTLLAIVIYLGNSKSANAADIYVDQNISDTCNTYNPTNRTCNGGNSIAYASLSDGVADTEAGDTVYIREGTYTERLEPEHSGTEGSPILFKNYGNEKPEFTNSNSQIVIVLDSVSFITIQGLTIRDTRWAEITSSNNITLQGNTFLRNPASGTTGNIRFIESTHNFIQNNIIDDGNDNLVFMASDYNLIEGNRITEGRHSVIGLRCSNYNIIRNNYFANTRQKIAEVYDCDEGTNAVPHIMDATKHNVIENNIFAEASSYYSVSAGNGIQYSGQDGIIRNNVFYQTNVGISMQVYSRDSNHPTVKRSNKYQVFLHSFLIG